MSRQRVTHRPVGRLWHLHETLDGGGNDGRDVDDECHFCVFFVFCDLLLGGGLVVRQVSWIPGSRLAKGSHCKDMKGRYERKMRTMLSLSSAFLIF